MILLSDVLGLSHLDVGWFLWIDGQGLDVRVGAAFVDGLLGVFFGGEVDHAEFLLLGSDPSTLERERSDGSEL